ncbi:MAG: PilZ domain-containing protein [Gammaproteobacteria bacterium]|nr:PilZ domain-containing protein [Gammaproteobacteria bacterium]
MLERRFDIRKIVNTPVRLYHPELGRFDGVTNDISDGGVALKLNSYANLLTEPPETPILLRCCNTDVLFPVSCLRQTESNLVVKFLE